MQLSNNRIKKENQNQAHMLHCLAGCSCIPPSSLPPTGSGLPEFHGPAPCASAQSCIWGGQAQSPLPALLVGVWGRGSWLLPPLPSLLEHKTNREWQLRFQSHKSVSQLLLEVQKTVQAVLLSAEESVFSSVGVGHGGRAEGASSRASAFPKWLGCCPWPQQGKSQPWTSRPSVLGVFRGWSHAWPSGFPHWYVCSDAFQEERVQVSWRTSVAAFHLLYFGWASQPKGKCCLPKSLGRHQM